MSVIVEIHDKN